MKSSTDRSAKATSECVGTVSLVGGQDVARGVCGGVILSAAIFTSSFLLFAVQPLMAKYILPWFGGGVAVWTVCMLFFQAMLLGGYAYAHASIRWLPPRGQVIVHGLLLAGAMATLPIVPNVNWRPLGAEDPTWRIMGLLAATLGLPYLALSATAPLLQGWFSRLNPGRSPYRLYALSNAASLLALLAYPFVVEPALSRRAQAVAWSSGLGVFAALLAACAILILRHGSSGNRQPAERDRAPVEQPGALRLAMWVLLPAVGSAMLLGATNKICEDVAPVPFLWVVPLALYLISYIIAFDSPRWYSRLAWVLLLTVAISLLGWMLMKDIASTALNIALYGGVMLACCMICHGELAKLKPDPAHLTMFYLCMAAGGAFGGAGVAIGAPLILRGYYEFHLAGLLACVLLMGILMTRQQGQRRLADTLALYLTIAPGAILALLMNVDLSTRPDTMKTVARFRSFHGALMITEEDEDQPLEHVRHLHHGMITHGTQYAHPSRRSIPTSYFARTSGVGLVLQTLRPDQPRRIGVIGLGVGTLAAYGKKGDVMRFYEINPQVEQLARTHFTYLADSAAKVEVVLGDARLSLEREPPQQYDLLIVDAFSGDAIPMHLITREATDLYLRHITADGAIVFHVSNAYLNLEPVLANQAERLGLPGLMLALYTKDGLRMDRPAIWVVLTRNKTLLESATMKRFGAALRGNARVGLWTDDYCSLLRVVRK